MFYLIYKKTKYLTSDCGLVGICEGTHLNQVLAKLDSEMINEGSKELASLNVQLANIAKRIERLKNQKIVVDFNCVSKEMRANVSKAVKLANQEIDKLIREAEEDFADVKNEQVVAAEKLARGNMFYTVPAKLLLP